MLARHLLHARSDARRRLQLVKRINGRTGQSRRFLSGPKVRGAREMLGLIRSLLPTKANGSPAFHPRPPNDSCMREPLGWDAAVIGTVVADRPGMVIMESVVGGERVVTMLMGEQLPRIC
jgi:hypothetical protein